MSARSIRDAAVAVRGRRTDLGLSQDELARRAGVSRKWVSEFEAGNPTAKIGLVIRVLEALGLRLAFVEDATPIGTSSVDLDELLDEHRRR